MKECLFEKKIKSVLKFVFNITASFTSRQFFYRKSKCQAFIQIWQKTKHANSYVTSVGSVQ